jgi:predicted metal-binding membrane protein
MWALMMVAMMLPSAAPMILLYERFTRRSASGGLAGTAMFALAYVGIWSLFSAAAAIAQAFLISTGLVSQMALKLGDGRIAGALLMLAGLYQLSALKRACLDSCRSPLSFLMRLWRPGAAGALRLGLAHGFYCLGCCWALMLLLFVGGVMSLAWIAGLAMLVFLEKLAPQSVPITRLSGGVLMVGGALLATGWLV